MDKRQEKDLELLETRTSLYSELSEIATKRDELFKKIESVEKTLENDIITREKFFPIDYLKKYIGTPFRKISCIKYRSDNGSYFIEDVFGFGENGDVVISESFITYLKEYPYAKIEREDGGYDKVSLPNPTYIIGWYNLFSEGKIVEGTSLEDMIRSTKTKEDYKKEL